VGISRRGLILGLAPLAARADNRAIEEVLRSAVERDGIPGLVAMVAGPDAVLFHGGFGKRSVAAGTPMTEDTVFRIFSMTKPITSVAVMQLVERGRLRLDDPIGKFLPSEGEALVLTETGELRPPRSPVTVRHLLTHTSGYAYPFWSKRLRDYTGRKKDAKPVLLFDPGEQWLYGTSTDVLGKVVENASGVPLAEYFETNIFNPLGMKETWFNVPGAALARMATSHQREGNGQLRESEQRPETVTTFAGGSGLYGTAADYVLFMQMILRRGMARNSRVLQERTVDLMARNQIGNLDAGRLATAVPALSNDVDFHPGNPDKFGFGFLINPVAYEEGRSRGSLAWAGALNTFFWIDPRSKLCAVLMMQILPFFDTGAVAALRRFEKTVYTAGASGKT
jgi:methyl acetate hydrolase